MAWFGRGAREANTDAFRQEALSHIDGLYAAALRLTRSPTEAEDLVQDTFVKAYRFQDRFEAGTNLRAWLYKIATNVANTELSRGTSEIPLVGEDEFHLAGDPGVEVLVEQRISVEQVAAAVTELPHKQRIALVMRKYQGFEYGEIARVLEISEGAARANVYLAVRRLRSEFHPEEIMDGGGRQ